MSCPNFNVSQIPEVDWRNLGAAFYKAIKEFYENPENLARFEEWNAQRLATSKQNT